jgi:ribonuclease D
VAASGGERLNLETQNASLRELALGARAAGSIALDTEFMGEGRYQTLLCLVQLAIPDREDGHSRVEIVDPLASDLDGAPLAAVLADPAIRVVVHAGRQDLALLRRRFGAEVRNVFDTQVAAGFVGMGAQCSYHSLLSELLGVHLAKGASFTRWDARPLSAEQLSYAREDVEHLLELAAELQRRLDALGRSEWAREECEPLERSSDERDPEAVFQRLPRVSGLSSAARPVARELVRWREQTAARQNRPVQSVLSDVSLIEVARRMPSSRPELERVRGIGAAGRRQRALELLEVVEKARGRPPDPAPRPARPPAPRTEDGPLVAMAEALLRMRAIEAGLAYELLATRAELHAIVAARRAGMSLSDQAPAGAAPAGDLERPRILYGWRRKLAGEELLELLDGRISLSALEGRSEIAIRCGCKLRTAAGTSK